MQRKKNIKSTTIVTIIMTRKMKALLLLPPLRFRLATRNHGLTVS
jgi:hypothetical protein